MSALAEARAERAAIDREVRMLIVWLTDAQHLQWINDAWVEGRITDERAQELIEDMGLGYLPT